MTVAAISVLGVMARGVQRSLISLFTPDDSIRTVVTADVYGAGEADAMLGRALAGVARDTVSVVGAVGHDF